MIRQYGPTGSSVRLTQTPRGPMWCGTIPTGAICRIDAHSAKVIIEGWLPRDYASWNPTTRRMSSKRIRGGHLAIVRFLADGRRITISDAWLRELDP